MNIRSDLMGNKINNLQRATEKKIQEASERLSTGLRINRAKDDAAGLAISERLIKNIKGNKVATRNIDDGINLLKTGQGSLSVIQEKLQRMRELAIQAKNGTYSEQDKNSIQNEINELISSIDNLANETTFNDLKFLNKGSHLEIGGAASPGYVQINPAPQYNFGTGDFTYSARFKPYEYAIGESWKQIFMKGSGKMEIQLYDGYINVHVGNHPTDFISYNTSWKFNLNEWYEVALTRESGVNKLYINGKLETSFTNSGSVSSASPIYIGGVGASELFKGEIDNVRLYNRSLSSSEVQENYNERATTVGLVGEWLFEEGSGSVVNDSSGYVNNGLIHGQATWGGKINVHTGSNKENTSLIEMENVTTQGIGVAGISIQDDMIIEKIDEAIQKVNSAQTNFGTRQNILEFKKDYINDNTTQLEQANSRISNTDFSIESSILVKEQIKLESSIKMLQKNMANRQGVLSLISG